MYIDRKYIHIMTGEPMMEYPPKIYLNFYKLTPNKRMRHIDCSSICINIGVFGLYLFCELKWGYVKIERKDVNQITLDMIDRMKGNK